MAHHLIDDTYTPSEILVLPDCDAHGQGNTDIDYASYYCFSDYIKISLETSITIYFSSTVQIITYTPTHSKPKSY